MSHLFSSLQLRDLTLRNRVVVSPMCQYSSEEGLPTDWHLVHLGSFAAGGAAMVMTEATAVSPEGRISPWDAGIWNEAQAEAYRRITRFIRSQGAVPAIQLAHAGRKASTDRPWISRDYVPPERGGWVPVGPSAVPFDARSPTPRALTAADIEKVVADFVAAAKRSLAAGFEAIEFHAAHGYLAHQFLSPLSNKRTDSYGGSLENRMRLPLRLAAALREAWPSRLPMLVRISATDYVEGGWEIEECVAFCRELKKVGVDLIDCSSGGGAPNAKIPAGPGYQVAYAQRIGSAAGIATGAVGMITDPRQAEAIVSGGQADVVLIAREFLRDPHWPLRAAHVLGAETPWPAQYERARWR